MNRTRSDHLVHQPGDKPCSRQPVAAGFDPPDPEPVALVDFNCAPLTAPRAFPDPEIGSLGLDVIPAAALDVVALEVDEALPNLFSPQKCVGSLGWVGHWRILKMQKLFQKLSYIMQIV